MTRGLGRFLRQNVIALLALFLALGGTSFAAATLINGKSIKPHTIAKNKLTNTAIKQLKGNRGPAGAAGARGATGAQGVQGVQGPGAQWAAVNPDGSIAKQSGGIASSHVQPGGYVLNFGSDVSRKLILASPTLINDGTFHGDDLAASCVDYAPFCVGEGVPDATKQNWIAVFTTATDNATQADHAFYVAAIGPAAATASASGGANLGAQSPGSSR